MRRWDQFHQSGKESAKRALILLFTATGTLYFTSTYSYYLLLLPFFGYLTKLCLESKSYQQILILVIIKKKNREIPRRLFYHFYKVNNFVFHVG